MKYLLFAFPLFIYFEFLGKILLYMFNRNKLEFGFGVGLVATIALLYVIGWPLSALNAPSIFYVFLILAYFTFTFVVILKNIKKLDLKINYPVWIIFIVLLAFEIYISWNRSLGEPHGFDAVYYINYIGFNVDTVSLNSIHPTYGTTPNTYIDTITYVFQSYNYFISSLIYILQKALDLVKMSLDFLPAYVWIFQILLHMMFITTSLNAILELKISNKVMRLALVVLLVLFMNNFYYNNSFGFFGNSYRMSVHALATIFLFRFFKSTDKIDLYWFYVAMLGLCGFSSTGTFATVFVLFGLFFFMYNREEKLLKQYALVLFVPLLNIVCVKLGIKWYSFVSVMLICGLVYVFNDFILKLYQNKYLRYGTLAAVALFLIVMSYRTTHDLFNFYGFINNYSERQDMSWDYFDFYDYRHWLFNPIVLIPLFYHLFKNPKDPFSIICIALMLSVYNPFGSTFMNDMCWVYYRTYDIIINQFTLAYFIEYLVNSIKPKAAVTGLILTLSVVLAAVQVPRYYHYMFEPDEDYNNVYKIENSELEVIKNVQQLVKDKKMTRPKIICPTFYMPTFIKDSEYLIGKEKRYDYLEYNDVTYGLYLIFFPSDGYDNFRPVDKPDYDNVIELLNECDYNILILENGLYVDYKGQYMPLDEAVTSTGEYTKSEYSTEKYAVIIINE